MAPHTGRGPTAWPPAPSPARGSGLTPQVRGTGGQPLSWEPGPLLMRGAEGRTLVLPLSVPPPCWHPSRGPVSPAHPADLVVGVGVCLGSCPSRSLPALGFLGLWGFGGSEPMTQASAWHSGAASCPRAFAFAERRVPSTAARQLLVQAPHPDAGEADEQLPPWFDNTLVEIAEDGVPFCAAGRTCASPGWGMSSGLGWVVGGLTPTAHCQHEGV